MPLVKKWQLDEHEGKADIHHRKWSWADEQGWHGSIIIPYSYGGWKNYANNPILAPRSGKWDSGMCHTPCVLKVNDVYYLYYTGGTSTTFSSARIGLVTDIDPYFQTKTYRGSDGLIITPPTGYSGVARPKVIYDDYETDSAKKWKMVCSGYNTADAKWHMLYYTSSDGIAWTYVGRLTPSTDALYVQGFIRFGNAYMIVFSRASLTPIKGILTRDFSAFSTEWDIVDVGVSPEWDYNAIGFATYFFSLGQYFLGYSGHNGTNWQLGLAVHSNFFKVHTKYNPFNPIISSGQYSWCNLHVVAPSLMMENEKFRIYTGGFPDTSKTQIGVFDIA